MKTKPTAFVADLRVGNARQSESGLGLEAQQATVEAFVRQHGGQIVGQHIEAESGKGSDYPELASTRCSGSRA